MLEPKTHLCLTTQKPYQPQPYLNCQGLPRPRSLPAVTVKGCDTGLRLLADTTLSLSKTQKEVLFGLGSGLWAPGTLCEGSAIIKRGGETAGVSYPDSQL